MVHLTGFGLENFRVFKEYTWFDFAPITILVGPNNSGKSTVIKALLLLKENLEKGILPVDLNKHSLLDNSLSFNSSTHNILNEKSLSNDKNESNVISFTFPSHPAFMLLLKSGLKMNFSFHVKNSAIIPYVVVKLTNNLNKIILEINQEKDYFYFDFQSLLDSIDTTKFDSFGKSDISKIPYLKLQRQLRDFWLEKKELHQDTDIFLPKIFAIDQVNDEYNKNGKTLLFHNLYYTLEDLLMRCFKEYEVENPNNYVIGTYNLLQLKSFDAFFQSLIGSMYLPTIKGKVSAYHYPTNEPHTIISLLSKITKKDSNLFRKRTNEEFEFMGQIVKPTYPGLDFLETWEMKFNIDGELNWKYDPETGVTLFTVGNRPLSDVGFGITQIITLLLAVYIACIEENKTKGIVDLVGKLLIVEEPEANLHPKLQSTIADLVTAAVKDYSNQFLIETHSEYMIRKFQYLVAKGEMKPEDIVIYYFNDPNNIPLGQKQVKKINILEDGTLSDDFGPGFYDEADNLAIDLFNLQKSRRN